MTMQDGTSKENLSNRKMGSCTLSKAKAAKERARIASTAVRSDIILEIVRNRVKPKAKAKEKAMTGHAITVAKVAT